MASLAKVGGLGDVMGSLPKALKKNGVDAEVVIPRYEHISKKNFKLVCRLGRKTVVYAARKKGVKVFLIDNKKYLSRGPVYFERTAFAGGKKEIDRFLFFSKAVFELIRCSFFKPDIVHANDWHTGFLVKLLKSSPKVVFTIHNLANQGAWRGKNWMAEGIKSADFVTTVSPTYAKEILTKEYGEGLERFLKKRAGEKKLKGILNGIDYSFWPSKKRDKIKFQEKLGLFKNKNAPIFGLVARLTSQKGINLIVPLVRKLIKKYGAEFVFLGQGEEENEKTLLKLAEAYPKNVFTKIGFDEKLAREIYANCDFFLMPSLFEPSGLGQMISMRYGTIPVARATGGLKDSITDGKTGFLFKEKSPQALLGAMKRALGVFYQKRKLESMRQNCKKQDFGWNISAKAYKKIYQKLLGRLRL